jgi:hypothetical protein
MTIVERAPPNNIGAASNAMTTLRNLKSIATAENSIRSMKVGSLNGINTERREIPFTSLANEKF